MTNAATTQNAQKFLAQNPTLIARIFGVDLYEHPLYGDETTLKAITADGRLKNTPFWEIPDTEEALLLLDL